MPALRNPTNPIPAGWIVVGRFGRVHGIKGFITLQSFTDPRDNLIDYAPWHGFVNHCWREIRPVEIKANDKAIIARIEGFPDRDSVSHLTHVELAVSEEKLPPLHDDEYYCHELIGMQVVNLDGISFGEVKDVMPTGANDVLVIQGEKKRLVPFLLDQYVTKIDKQQRLITVDWDADF